jgi:hypothetical protein
VALVRVRSRYRVRGVECSNYRTFRTSLPTPLAPATTYALWFTWVGYTAAVCSYECRFYRGECQVYDDNVNLVQDGIIHQPSTPIAGFIPLIGAVKPEMCVGIVALSHRFKRRTYMTGFVSEYVTEGGELKLVGEIALGLAEHNIFVALDQVLVKWKAKEWEPVETSFVQKELMTHNSRKVHVPFALHEEIPG